MQSPRFHTNMTHSPYAKSNLERLETSRLLHIRDKIDEILDLRDDADGNALEEVDVDEHEIGVDGVEAPRKRRRVNNPSGDSHLSKQCMGCDGDRPLNKVAWATGVGEPWHFITSQALSKKMKKDGYIPTEAELQQEMTSTGKYCEPCRWAAKDLRVKLGAEDLSEEIRASICERRMLWPIWPKQDARKDKVLVLIV